MIISIDGNVYLGKTSLITQLIDTFCWECVEEYDTDVDILESLEYHSRQDYYFGLEKERLQFLSKPRLILDRSYLSFMAHAYAFDRLEEADLFSYTLSLLKHNIKGNVLQMDKMLFFVQNGKYDRYYDIHQKTGEEILYDDTYRQYIDEFFYKLAEKFKQAGLDCFRLVFEGEVISAELLQWLEQEPQQSAHDLSSYVWKSLECLCDRRNL